MPGDPLDDARLLHDRALAHIADYNRLAGSNGGLWRVMSGCDGDAFTSTLILDRAALRALKPVIGDIANNLIHALDLVAAVAYQASADDRPRNLYFPISADDNAYAKKSAALEKLLDRQWLDLFAALRDRHKPYQSYLELLKLISNDAKHWQLVAGGAGAAAVAWTVPGDARQTIVDIPRDHFAANDAFTFWRDGTPFPNLPVLTLTQHRFEMPDRDASSVDSVFSTCSRFVADVIDESRQRLV